MMMTRDIVHKKVKISFSHTIEGARIHGGRNK